MQAAYFEDGQGHLQPRLPEVCPEGLDGSACRVGVHGRRARKTGPRFPLVVARCHRHGRSFTVYPPAHVPYSRAAVTPVDVAGHHVRNEVTGAAALGETVFEAAADAARGDRWAESGELRGSRRTQGRRLSWMAVLFGLTSPARQRERLATALGIAALGLHEAAAELDRACGWRERAEVLLVLLRQVLAAGRPEALVRAGHVAGLWGRPSRWDPGGHTLRPLF